MRPKPEVSLLAPKIAAFGFLAVAVSLVPRGPRVRTGAPGPPAASQE
jgi:hypothetical protein